jgi:3-oxoacyl-[acyl-carrier protein] reductase
MNLALERKVALVCASSAGIGRAIAAGLAAEGARVSMFARTRARLEAACSEVQAVARAAGGDAICQAGDVGVRADLERIVEETRRQFGAIDILVNNQGGPEPGTLEQISDEHLDAAIGANLRSVFQLSRLCLPEMKTRGFGRVINILSLSAKEPLPGMLLSNMLRPAILGFAKTVAQEYAPFGITVNSLLPAAVQSDRTNILLQRRAAAEGKDFAAVLAQAGKSIPVGHIATPEEFAALAVFLCSPQASYITGTAIPVDGGASRSLY